MLRGPGAHGNDVVDGRGDGILRDVVVPGAVRFFRSYRYNPHGIGHQGLGAQAFGDGGEVGVTDVHHVGRLPAACRHLPDAGAFQVAPGGPSRSLGEDLQGIDPVVVHAGICVGQPIIFRLGFGRSIFGRAFLGHVRFFNSPW